MNILGFLIGTLLGIFNFYLTYRLIKMLEKNQAKMAMLLFAKLFLGLFLVCSSCLALWIIFHINPFFVLTGIFIGRTLIFRYVHYAGRNIS